MAGLLTNSERALKRSQVSERNAAAMAQIDALIAQRQSPLSDNARHHWQLAQKTGFPAFRQEDWHYTSLDNLLAAAYQQRTGTINVLPAGVMTTLNAYRVVLVDGVFAPQWSDPDLGAYELSIADDRREFPAAVNGEIFLHLTESLAQSPLIILVKPGVQAEKPLYIVNISIAGNDALNMNHCRCHLEIGANAAASVIEHFISFDSTSTHFTGARLSARIGENSDFRHLKLGFENSQAYHFAHNDLVIDANARVESTSFLLGGKLTRHHTSTQLNGEGVMLSMNSLVLPKNGEVADTRTYLEHNKGYCESRQRHKVIVMDNSKAVFNGMIKVAPHALKTDGQMTNNNLLLGKKAEVDTKPQLEIYADDVKCSHGATIGRIDEEQLFYLRARGIPEKEAKQMIVLAFAAELTDSISDSVLNDVVMTRIRGVLEQGDKERV